MSIKQKITYLSFVLSLSGCGISLSQIDFDKGERAQEKGEYTRAVDKYKKVIKRVPGTELSIKAAQRGIESSMFGAKDYSSTVDFYKYIINFGKTEKTRRHAQEGLATVYLEKLLNYRSAIEEFNKLLIIKNDAEKIIDYRQNLAKAHFSLNQFDEALSELELALKLTLEPSRKYELLVMKGNILFNTKDVESSLLVYEQIVADYPVRAKSEKILMNVIVCLEELQRFEKAIAQLEVMRQDYDDKEFIDLKIMRLKNRKANMPGSKGMRK